MLSTLAVLVIHSRARYDKTKSVGRGGNVAVIESRGSEPRARRVGAEAKHEAPVELSGNSLAVLGVERQQWNVRK